MIRLVQLGSTVEGRRVAIVDEPRLRLLGSFASVYDCARAAAAGGKSLEEAATGDLGDESLDYAPIYDGQSTWRLLPPIDHPRGPEFCLVSGTGLTHRKSAANRDAMHQATPQPVTVSDSMRIYQLGAEGGRPGAGEIGAQPEWFYKGDGRVLRGHGDALEIPEFADDGGEEAEVAGIYVIGADGSPLRLGFAAGNEFSDHVMERKNYLYLAPSKVRQCAIGPEIAIGAEFASLEGHVAVERTGETVWSAAIATGEANMVHSLANLEHHHFKYPEHRVPGSVHVHFFGADAFSFGDGVRLQDGDTMAIRWNALGRPLRNCARVPKSGSRLWRVRAL
ncbi:MAG TPA: AraD1 family protein [Chthonomonadaceae bacterium]|nr:AraD1 family protein [Chthonomonadaceae bacterium]